MVTVTYSTSKGNSNGLNGPYPKPKHWIGQIHTFGTRPQPGGLPLWAGAPGIKDERGETMKVIAVYDKDTRRFHRYLLKEGQDVTGVLYFPRTGEIPKEVIIELRVQK